MKIKLFFLSLFLNLYIGQVNAQFLFEVGVKKHMSIGNYGSTNINDHKLGDFLPWSADGIIIAITKDEQHGIVVKYKRKSVSDWINAIQGCWNSPEGGFRDWFLPTKKQFDILKKLPKFKNMIKNWKRGNPHFWVYEENTTQAMFYNGNNKKYEYADRNDLKNYLMFRSW